MHTLNYLTIMEFSNNLKRLLLGFNTQFWLIYFTRESTLKTYHNSSFSKSKVIALAALLAGTGLAQAAPYHSHNKMTAHVGGRVQADYVRFMGDEKDKNGNTSAASAVSATTTRFSSGANLRRTNLFLAGNLSNNYGYYLRADFGKSGSTASSVAERDRVKVQRAELHYHYNDFTFNFGQLYVPMGMDWTTDASDHAFMERSAMSNAFYERNHLGVSASTYGDMFTVSGAIVTKGFGGDDRGFLGGTNTNDEALNRGDKFAYMLRLTVSPVHENDMAYHFGFNAKHKSLHTETAAGGADTKFYAWSVGPELRSRQSPTNILSTHDGANGTTTDGAVSSFNMMGLEAAAKWNAFHAQFEYTRLKAKYSSRPNESYSGWYLQAGWVFSGGDGRHYNFKQGVFEKPMINGGCGAWELAARYSRVDLNDNNVTFSTARDTGKMKGYTVGVNWYANNNVTFQANYVHNKFNFRTAEDRTAKGFGVRAQFEF